MMPQNAFQPLSEETAGAFPVPRRGMAKTAEALSNHHATARGSLPAGVARMPFWRFTWLTVAGVIPWVLAFALLGKAVGNNWHDWQAKLHYVDYAIAAGILGAVVYLIVRRRRRSDTGGVMPIEAGDPDSPVRPAPDASP